MTNTFLISETKLRQFSDINNNVDTELLRNAVREAQDIEIQRIIGTLLYDSLMTQVDNGSFTNANYETLVNDYLQNALLYWAYYYALEDIMIRPRNNGVLVPTGGENSIEADKYYYNTKRQSVKNKAEFYSEKLTNYIITNTNLFPEPALTTSTDCTEDLEGSTLSVHTTIPLIIVAVPTPVTPPDGAEEIATLGAELYPPPLFDTVKNLIPPLTTVAVAVAVDPIPLRVNV